MKRRSTSCARWRAVFLVTLAAAAPGVTLAQTDIAPSLWELGGVTIGISQQAYPGSDQQVGRALALPYLVYLGDVFRADNDSAGLRALKTPDFELDIGVAGAANDASPLVRKTTGGSLGVGVDDAAFVLFALGETRVLRQAKR